MNAKSPLSVYGLGCRLAWSMVGATIAGLAIAVIAGAGELGFFLALFIPAAGMALGALSLSCPKCGKSPFRLGIAKSGAGQFVNPFSMVPEAQCSRCSTNLRTIGRNGETVG